MTLCLDTRVIVSALVGGSRDHDRCLPWLDAVLNGAHRHQAPLKILDEVFAVLTSTRKFAFRPAVARALVEPVIRATDWLPSSLATSMTAVVAAASDATGPGHHFHDHVIVQTLGQAGTQGIVSLDPEVLVLATGLGLRTFDPRQVEPPGGA